MTIRQPIKGAAAFSKTIAVLQLIADSENPIASAELVKKTGMPRPTMRRILKALIAEDMVELGPNKTFTLGARHIEFARKSLDQNSLLRTVSADLGRLSDETDSSVCLGVPLGIEFIVIAENGASQATVGSTGPYNACAIAKAYLAFVPDDRREKIIDSIEMPSLTEHTTTCRDRLRAELKQTAADGYSVSDQQLRIDEKWLGACVVDAKTTPCAGIGLSMKRSQTDAARESKYLSALLQCRDRINQKLQQVKFECSPP